MKRIYTVGILFIAILIGVLIGQSQGFVLAKDEVYLNEKEDCYRGGCLQKENQNRIYKSGCNHHKESFNHNNRVRKHNQRCVR